VAFTLQSPPVRASRIERREEEGDDDDEAHRQTRFPVTSVHAKHGGLLESKFGERQLEAKHGPLLLALANRDSPICRRVPKRGANAQANTA